MFIKRIFAGTANILFVIQIFYPQITKAGEKPLKSNIEVSGPAIADTLIKVPEDLSQPSKTKNVKALADRVRGHVNSQPLRFPNQHWVRGAYYAGLMAMYESTSDRAYLDDCMAWGKQVSWQIKEQGGGPYESGAYPLICGQIWYGCYQAKKDELMMQPTLAFLEDPKVENPLSAPGKWYLENSGYRFVDGLFTAPPALAMLYQMTGDEKYVKWMDACFWDVHGEIFDHDAGLFYRDARSIPRKTKNGKKVLWSRGNGWAFGGLTRILKHLPEHHKSYARYKALYVQMAESLAMRQQRDGFWRSNLDDPEQYTMKESSGTGFFCYGITWGINNGILNRERFLPVARKAWTALASVVNEHGQFGWSQPAGGGPGNVAEADTSKFGTGIFLLAASEMFLLTKSPFASKPLGLSPGPNATVMLNGKPYRGVGINYFSCFLRTLKDGNDTSYDAGFATLAEKGIPFARFCATGFWPRHMKLYVEDREEYFRRLDGVVHSAEKHGIGLIPSLFWYYACVPDLVGEPMDQWANPNSKTQAWMRHYVREVVTRYRDNPTIWAWELGNEFSLHANLLNAKDHRPKVHHSLGTPDARSERDDLTYEMVGKAFSAFATAVRKHDTHRLIFTGDSFPRLSAWHQEQENSWTHDTMEQFAEMLTKVNPDPISGISLHAYEDDDQRFDVAMAVARKLNKPIFIGEFGAQRETPEQNAKCRRLLKAIIDHKIPLAALWVFDQPLPITEFNVTADNGRAWQLELIAETNRKLKIQVESRDQEHKDH
jgi:unsaturated rhamnogalacturonyl hydrolase